MKKIRWYINFCWRSYRWWTRFPSGNSVSCIIQTSHTRYKQYRIQIQRRTNNKSRQQLGLWGNWTPKLPIGAQVTCTCKQNNPIHRNKTCGSTNYIETKHVGQQITSKQNMWVNKLHSNKTCGSTNYNQTNKYKYWGLEFDLMIHKTCWVSRVQTMEKEEHKIKSQFFHAPKHN